MRRRGFFTVMLSGLIALLGVGPSEKTTAADGRGWPRKLFRWTDKYGFVFWQKISWHEMRPGDRVMAVGDVLVQWTVGDYDAEDVQILTPAE